MPDESVSRPSISELWTETKAEEVTLDSDVDIDETPQDDPDVDADATDDESDGDDDASEEKTEEPEEEKTEEQEDTEEEVEEEKTTAEQVLELLKDPKTLAAALNEAGVETLQELPIVKELLGRERQSATDQTKADIARQEFEQKNVTQRLESGRKALDEFIADMEKLSEDIEKDADDIVIPDADFIKERFQTFSAAAVEAYHNKTWGDLSEMIYSLPELQAAPDEAKAELAQFNGAAPSDWLGAHLEVARQTLWNLAQQAVQEAAEKRIADQQEVLTAAHKAELEKITAKHERQLKKAVEDAKKSTRAELLADAASGKLPPRVAPKDRGGSGSTDDDDIPAGASISEIFKREKARQASGVGV